MPVLISDRFSDKDEKTKHKICIQTSRQHCLLCLQNTLRLGNARGWHTFTRICEKLNEHRVSDNESIDWECLLGPAMLFQSLGVV